MTHSKILVVEEDNNLRRSMALILQHAGYFVAATGNSHEASEWIQSGKYHLIIMDTLMTDTNRILLPKVLGYYPDLSIVILSDRPIPEVDNETKPLGARYLIKPIAPEFLLDCVKTLLGQKQDFDPNGNRVNIQ